MSKRGSGRKVGGPYRCRSSRRVAGSSLSAARRSIPPCHRLSRPISEGSAHLLILPLQQQRRRRQHLLNHARRRARRRFARRKLMLRQHQRPHHHRAPRACRHRRASSTAPSSTGRSKAATAQVRSSADRLPPLTRPLSSLSRAARLRQLRRSDSRGGGRLRRRRWKGARPKSQGALEVGRPHRPLHQRLFL